MAKMTVYHGGYTPVKHPEIREGRNTKDFGTGFYCTVIKEQAQRWAKRYDDKIVSIYEVPTLINSRCMLQKPVMSTKPSGQRRKMTTSHLRI